MQVFVEGQMLQYACVCVCCRLPLDDPWSVLRLLCPDLGVCVVALITIILCSRLVRNREMVAAANITSVSRLCVTVRVSQIGTEVDNQV